MRNEGVPIPDLDPSWPDAMKVAVVVSREAPFEWRRFAHEVAAAVQPGGDWFDSRKNMQVTKARKAVTGQSSCIVMRMRSVVTCVWRTGS